MDRHRYSVIKAPEGCTRISLCYCYIRHVDWVIVFIKCVIMWSLILPNNITKLHCYWEWMVSWIDRWNDAWIASWIYSMTDDIFHVQVTVNLNNNDIRWDMNEGIRWHNYIFVHREVHYEVVCFILDRIESQVLVSVTRNLSFVKYLLWLGNV